MRMMYWLVWILFLVAYAITWYVFLKPAGFSEPLYAALTLVVVFIGVRVYWQIYWHRWRSANEYFWIPYYAVFGYFMWLWFRETNG